MVVDELSPPRVTLLQRQKALEVNALSVSFGKASQLAYAVRGVSLAVNQGEAVGILGESGSGKSVTCRAILRLLGNNAQLSGDIAIEGRDISQWSEPQMQTLRGNAVGFIPQVPRNSLVPLARIGKQIGEVLRIHNQVTTKKAAQVRAGELLRRVGIADPARVLRAYPHELSGGMCQRVVIAMAIACEPKLLIADEPTTALDVTVQAQVLELFDELRRELNAGLLLVTHDVGVVRDVAETVVVMYAGRIVESGSVAEVLDAPRHPYTQALLGAMPTPGVPRGQLTTITGMAPSATAVSQGCAFAPRCAYVADVCFNVEPQLVANPPEHFHACLVDPFGPAGKNNLIDIKRSEQ